MKSNNNQEKKYRLLMTDTLEDEVKYLRKLKLENEKNI